MNYNIGDTVHYRVIDEEYRSRGYGIIYETGSSKIRSIQYTLENGITVSESGIQEKKGDTITYRTVDMEYYSRGYGLAYETGTSKIRSLRFILENGYDIGPSNIIEKDASTSQ